eukprot:scaffold1138_cov217-Prasinococcus_capsulatus_cf.AAC.4
MCEHIAAARAGRPMCSDVDGWPISPPGARFAAARGALGAREGAPLRGPPPEPRAARGGPLREAVWVYVRCGVVCCSRARLAGSQGASGGDRIREPRIGFPR